jgi:hypothetical protein
MRLVLTMLAVALALPAWAAEWPEEIVTLHSTLETARQDLSAIDCSELDAVPNQDADCESTRSELLTEVEETMNRIENDSDASIPLSSNVIGDARDLIERTHNFVGD